MARFRDIGPEAERLFVQEQKTLEEIQSILRGLGHKVSITSLSLWKKRYKWGEKRDSYSTSPQGAAETAKQLVIQIAEEIRQKIRTGENIDPGLVDKFTKAVGSLEKLENKVDPRAQTLFVMKNFVEYMQKKGQAAQKLLEELEDYLRDFSRHMEGFAHQ